MMKKRFLVLFFILSFLLSACGFEDEYSEDTSISRPSLNGVDGDLNISGDFSSSTLDALEGKDYGGREFVVVTTDSKYWSFDGGESFVSKAVFERNDAIENKFNINIRVEVETPSEIIEKATLSKEQGTHYADLVVAPANVLSQLMANGLLMNMTSLPYVDYSAEYVDSSLLEASQINGKLFMLFGALTQTEYSGWCVFYNKSIAEKTGIDPYDLYKDGGWTWDDFLDYSEKSSKYAKSGFVTTATESDFVNTVWASAGKRFFGECSSSPLELPSVENASEIISLIKKVIGAEFYGDKSGLNALDAFIKGESSVLLCRRDAVYTICDSGMDWGVVPMPKYGSDGEHLSYIDGEAMAVSVLPTITDTEFVGRVLNAFMAATDETVTDAIYKNELYFYWQNNETALRMEKVKDQNYLDIAIIYAYAEKEVAAVTTEHIVTVIETGIKPFSFYHSTRYQFQMYSDSVFG